MTGTLVAGLGSPHGDDQLGWRLVDSLADAVEPSIELAAIAGPLDLLDNLAGIGRLVVVDACRTGGEPGTITRLEWPDTRIHARHRASTHRLSVAEALRLAETLDRLPPRVVIFGVEVASISSAAELSPVAAASLGELARLVLEEVRSKPSGVVDPIVG